MTRERKRILALWVFVDVICVFAAAFAALAVASRQPLTVVGSLECYVLRRGRDGRFRELSLGHALVRRSGSISRDARRAETWGGLRDLNRRF